MRAEFYELAALIADEVIPTAVPLGDSFKRDLAEAVLRFILTDAEMRPLLRTLLDYAEDDQ